MEVKKLRYVDAMRGFAIIGVLMVHCMQAGSDNYPKILYNLFANGGTGVQLFFVASAFTLFLSLKSRKSQEKDPTVNFFIRRFFRIAPMYYIGIIYYLWQNGFGPNYWLGNAPGITIGNILANVFFIHDFNPYWINSLVPGGWSIATEMLFYCIVPFLFSKIKTLNQAVALFVVSTVVCICLQKILLETHFIPERSLLQNYLYFFLPGQLPVFSCGIILYFMVTTPVKEWNINPNYILFVSMLLLLRLATTSVLFLPDYITLAILFAILGFALSKNEALLFVNPFTRYVGKISYSMYLVHFAVLHWMVQLKVVEPIKTNTPYKDILNYGVRFVILLILTAIVSTIFYHLIEVPFQRMGKKITQYLRTHARQSNLEAVN
jgi:peptidoglycan/LPS O-acetylase OafA/YrhL